MFLSAIQCNKCLEVLKANDGQIIVSATNSSIRRVAAFKGWEVFHIGKPIELVICNECIKRSAQKI